MVIRVSHIPLYLQIEEELRGLVQSGELAPLAQVLSESELSERFDVSRMTARKALDRLVGEGILFRRPGKGTFVAPPKIAHNFLTQLSFSAKMRDLGLRHGTRVLDAGLVSGPSHIATALSMPAHASMVYIRRLRLVEDEPAAIHICYLPGRYAGILEGDLTGSLTALAQSVGARVTQERNTVQAVIATGEDGHLLGVPVGSPLVRVEGVAFSPGLEPLRYTEALYRGDRFQFTVDTTPRELRLEVKSDIAGAR